MVMARAAVEQLPRGRHGLSRDEVAASQRGRMLAACFQVVAEKGYTRFTVADVLAAAGVSRETFYEHFSDKEDCFLAAYELSVDAVLAAMSHADPGGESDPLERYEEMMRGYLQVMSQEGGYARVFLVDVYAAGERALKRRREVIDRFTEVVAELVGARTAADRFACEALVAAVSSLVTVRVAAGDLEEIPELRRPIMDVARRLLDTSSLG
jgi:AcrR family transcriptional regulator